MERPPQMPSDLASASWVAREAASLPRWIRAVGVLATAGTAVPTHLSAGGALNLLQARRVFRAADELNAPPQSPLALSAYVAGQAYRVSSSSRWGWGTWRGFRARATTEEHLVGEMRVALAADLSVRARAAALRPFSQQAPWFPGFGGPSPAELHQRHGVKVTFDSGIPEDWRPYCLAVLYASIGAMRGVLPQLDLQGLHVEIPLRSHLDYALASHDANIRTLSWPAVTGSGSLAHEIAHDLDWQEARRRCGSLPYAGVDP